MPQPITDALRRSAKPKDRPYEIRDGNLRGLVMRIQPNGKRYFYAEWERGKRRRIPNADDLTLTQIRTEARAIMAAGRKGQIHQARKRRTLGTFIEDEYKPWAVAELKTGAAIVARLTACFKPSFWNTDLDRLTQWGIEKWRAERLRAGKATATVNRDITALKAALNKAKEWGFIEINPIAAVKPKRVDSAAKVRYLTHGEETRLREALDAREAALCEGRESGNRWRAERGRELLKPRPVDYLKVAVLVSLNTGLRRGELFGLTWDNVNLGARTVTVEGYGAKSGKTRHIPLNAEALAELRRWKKDQGAEGIVFKGRTGGGLTHTKRSWARVLEEAAIEDFRWHDLRHHFASRLVMAGIDLNTVRELLGHGDIGMTLRYAHLAPEHKHAAVAALDR